MGLFEDLSKFSRRQEAVITAFSKIGYRVVPRKGTPCINRDKKTVYLPVVDPAKYPNVLTTIRGWTDHEMAHELYKSDHEVLKKAMAKGKKFESIFRYIEDGRVERLESRDFEGCRENLLYGEREALAERKKMGLTLYLAGKYGVEGIKLYKMEEWGAIVGEDIIEKCNKIETCQDAYDVAQEAYGRIQKYIDDAVTGEMETEAAEEESELHPTVSKEGPKDEKKEKKESKREADEILQDEKDKPESEKDKKKSESESKKDDKDGESESESKKEDKDGESEDADDDSEADGDTEDDRTPDGRPEGKEDKAEVVEDDEAEEGEEGEEGDSGDEGSDSSKSEVNSKADKDSSEDSEGVEGKSGDGIDEEEKKSRIESKLDEMIEDKDLMDDLLKKLHDDLDKIPEDPRAYTPCTVNDQVYDLTRDHSGFYSHKWFPRLIDEARSKVNALAQKLRLELFTTKMMFERYKDRGRLDQRRLHVLGMGTTTDVFMKRLEQPELDTAISLLIDSSGSMDGKIQLAAQVAYLLTSTLETLNVPTEVLSFTADWKGVTGLYPPPRSSYDRNIPLHHFIHKSFSTKLRFCTEAMNRIGCLMSQNTDGESVLWAAARLATRKEKRRILFVLSDGEPYNGDTDPYKLQEHLKHIIGMVSKAGIECVGIGIETSYVNRFYPHNVVVNNINDLVTTAYGEVVKAIRGAKREVR